jgi:hypothetical protein
MADLMRDAVDAPCLMLARFVYVLSHTLKPFPPSSRDALPIIICKTTNSATSELDSAYSEGGMFIFTRCIWKHARHVASAVMLEKRTQNFNGQELLCIACREHVRPKRSR